MSVLNDVLIGSFFIDGDLTAEKYEAMLRDQIFSTIKQIAGENFAEILERWCFTTLR